MTSRRLKTSTNWIGRVVPITNRPLPELQRVVEALNGKFQWEQVLGIEEAVGQERRFKETPRLLRELVQALQLSGMDSFRFSCEHRNKWADVQRYWEEGRRLNPLLLLGTPGGGAGIGMNNRPELDPYNEALRLFIEFLLNPECGKLAGPCPRCDHYYIRRSVRNNKYCSRSCGTRATALNATRKRREEDHADKIRRAALSAEKWTTMRTRLDWKQWTSRKEPEISVKFLTRAVNNGDLKPPTTKKL